MTNWTAKKDLLFDDSQRQPRTDIAQVKPTLTYDYFQRELLDQEQARAGFSKFFDTLSDMQPSGASSHKHNH